MNNSKIEVSASALHALLCAVVSPAHHMRELQVTMDMPFGEVLIKEFKEYAEKQNETSTGP